MEAWGQIRDQDAHACRDGRSGFSVLWLSALGLHQRGRIWGSVSLLCYTEEGGWRTEAGAAAEELEGDACLIALS